MAQALYRKWRPQTFDDVVGQEHIVRTLRHALHTGHVHHAYLLAGPRGTGKTTTARLIAKAVNCLDPDIENRPCNQCEICRAIANQQLMDLVEIDAASNTGVDNIRDLLEKVGFHPARARYKVYVIDEVHMLSTASFNALLKTLEEPPEHVLFVLATTEPHKILPTVLSRCQRFEFRRIPLREIVGRLERIAEEEEVEASPEALDLIARAATGSMRDAISLFDQMAADGIVTAEYVRTMLGAERRDVVQSLVQAWLDGDLDKGLQIVNHAVDSGADPRQLAGQTADFLRGLLLMRLGAGDTWTDPTPEERPHLQEMAQQAKPNRLVAATRRFSEVAAARRSGWQPQLPLELAFVEVTLEPEPAETQVIVQQVREKAGDTVRESSTSQRQVRRVRKIQPDRPSQQDAGQEASSSEAEETAAAPSSAVELAPETMEKIREYWREIVGRVQSANVSLGALLRSAKPLGVDLEGRLVLGFRHEFHRNRVQQDENRRQVEDILSNMFSQKIIVRCEGESWQPPAQPTASEASPKPTPESAPQKSASSSSSSSAEGESAAASPKAQEKSHSNEKASSSDEDEDAGEDELVRRAQEELGAVVTVGE